MVVTVAGLFSLTGCGSDIFTPAKLVDGPERGYALVSFIRPSILGARTRIALWDGDEFIGILAARSVVQYKARPGHHVFIATAENWSYVDANLQAGKHYVVVGRVFPGAWKARVGLDPADNPGQTREAIDKYVKHLIPIMVPDDAKEKYAARRRDRVRRAVDKFNAGEVKYATLSAGSGV
jgi:hypothetical protein